MVRKDDVGQTEVMDRPLLTLSSSLTEFHQGISGEFHYGISNS